MGEDHIGAWGIDVSAKLKVVGAGAAAAIGTGLTVSLEGFGGASGTMAVTGASVGAASAATVILATGGAVALCFVGYGIYRHYAKK